MSAPLFDPAVSAALHAGHWRDKRRLTCRLLAFWLVSTFSVIYFARDLDHVVLFGWPLSYYMAAQGLALVYLSMLVIYNRRIQHMERALDQALALALAPAAAAQAAANPERQAHAG